jgi:thioredoxin reductase (NADPH)
MREFHETIIVGGGPAGLTAGIYLKRAGIDLLLLEKEIVSGTPLQTDRIENYPGFPEGISGRELMGRMAEQGRQFGLTIKEFSPVSTTPRREKVSLRLVWLLIHRTNLLSI